VVAFGSPAGSFSRFGGLAVVAFGSPAGSLSRFGHAASTLDSHAPLATLCAQRSGGVAERSNAAVSKTVSGGFVRRGFKSLPLRSLGQIWLALSGSRPVSLGMRALRSPRLPSGCIRDVSGRFKIVAAGIRDRIRPDRPQITPMPLDKAGFDERLQRRRDRADRCRE
jgi:hypothetical protein